MARQAVVRVRGGSTLAAILALALAVPLLSASPVAAQTRGEVISADVPAAVAAPSATIGGVTFDPGYIISDALFYDDDAMTATQIQDFLDRMVGTCSNTLCLNVYKMSTASRTDGRGNVICQPYTGGSNESVATILFKVQQACGISAKVLLATLQKEQGLVTKKAPTAGELKIAMGYACPDTAACDAKYFGFFNQVYSAAWQFKRYSTPDRFGNVQPGVEAIQYHPNASCGTRTVNVRNNATAALYNYTPYTPNSAALSNLYGAAPPCGSYGNRNFWVFYNSWFGTSIGGSALDAITSLHLVLGGDSGALGAPGPAPSCPSTVSVCSRTFEHGLIYWTKSGGPIAVSGAIGDFVLANPGVTGAPTGQESSIVHANGNGRAQQFARGMVHAGPDGTFFVPAALLTTYSAAGWVRGSLGWPVSAASCGVAPAGCAQEFQRGWIASVPGKKPAVMTAALAAGYSAAGGPGGDLGLPTTLSVRITDRNGNGYAQGFVDGMLHAGPAGTFAVSGAIYTRYTREGWLRGALGWPVSAESCVADVCSQSFAGGLIRATGGSTTEVVYPGSAAEIATLHATLGGDAGDLGAARGAVTAIRDPRGNGYVRQFANGWAYSSSRGTFAVLGAMQTGYSANGWIRGVLGWPIADQVCDGSGCTQEFAGGTLVVPASGPARLLYPVAGEIATVWAAAGGATGELGYPTAAEKDVTDPKGNGSIQTFEGGWVHASELGAFAVPRDIMTVYSKAGWLRGSFGWPKTASVCDALGCTQKFVGGVIRDPLSGTPFVVGAVSDSRIRAVYDATGGVTGSLGYATTPVTTIYDARNGNGKVQAFEFGWIYYSSSGTFAVPAAVQSVYTARGWLRGPLGWPTGAATCDAGGCVQSFQNGTIDTH